MSTTRTARATALAALVLLLLPSGGCFFEDDVITVTTVPGETGGFSVNISKTGVTAACSEDSPSTFSCLFAGLVSSELELLSPEELLFLLLLLDPLVVQLPDEVTAVRGSWVNFDTGDSGSLQVTPGLATVPVDDDRTLVAEPGTQLVIVELPPGAPALGSFGFNLRFDVPPGTTEVVARPLFTGRVELTDGSVFFAPLFPCVSEMAAVPALTLPIVLGSTDVPIPPLDANLGCDGEIYRYGALAAPAPTEVPSLDGAGLVALALLLAAAGWWRARRAVSWS